MYPTTDHRPRNATAANGSRASRFPPLPNGIADLRELPDSDFTALWDAIKVDAALKDRLLAQALLNFTVRGVVPRSALPLHGIILLVGRPGTGKTSLAKGLASRVAEAFGGRLGGKAFRFAEVDPHALSSGSLGKTQRAVTELFSSAVVEQALLGPSVILLDEVESILVDRAKLSMEANPIDVHRATDAALVQLDHLAESHPNILFVATSNFPQAIDSAFISRADAVIVVPPPDTDARLEILRDTLSSMGAAFPALRTLAASRELTTVAREAEGLDGRAMRKLVAAACARDRDVALDPNRLSKALLLDAVRAAVSAQIPQPSRSA